MNKFYLKQSHTVATSFLQSYFFIGLSLFLWLNSSVLSAQCPDPNGANLGGTTTSLSVCPGANINLAIDAATSYNRPPSGVIDWYWSTDATFVPPAGTSLGSSAYSSPELTCGGTNPLVAGSIAFVQYASDDPDIFSFVALSNIAGSTVINFTDNGWETTDNTFRSGEGILSWTAPVAGIAMGNIVSITAPTAPATTFTTTTGTVTSAGSFALAAAGDQLIAFCGTFSATSSTGITNLAAIHFTATTWTTGGATDANTSGLPTGLTEGTTALALGNFDNAAYNCTGGTQTGTAASIADAINTASNWTTNNALPAPVLPSCLYQITGGTTTGLTNIPANFGATPCGTPVYIKGIVNPIPTGCDAALATTNTLTVTVVCNPMIADAITQPTCAAPSSGAIDLTITPAGSYTYDWGDIAGTSNPEDRTSLAAGTYMVTVSNATGCMTTGSFMINAPTGCAVCTLTSAGLTAVTCNNNGTNPSTADDYITFSLNPIGTTLGATYNVSVSSGTVTLAGGGAATSVAYGDATAFRLQNGSAGAGNVIITVTDAVTGAACTVTATITDPGDCSSSVCTLTSAGLTAVACNNNGTNPSTADDYITFSLNPIGSTLGATYDVSVSSGTVTLADGGAAIEVAYGTVTAFRLQNGSAGAGNVIITVTDAVTGAACTITANISDPGACSSVVCTLTSAGLSAVACNNNGTLYLPADDYTTFSLNPVGTTLGANYSVSVNNGSVTLADGNPATNIAYGTTTGFRLQNGTASGGLVTVTLTDDVTGAACIVNADIDAPGACSNLVCPTIIGSTSPTSFCNNSDLTLSIFGLSNMDMASNDVADYGIIFLYFPTEVADPYIGGTVLGTVPFALLESGGTSASINVTAAQLPPVGADYYWYAILTPTPTDPNCHPFRGYDFIIEGPPTTFNVTGGGEICNTTTTTTQFPIGLAGSQTGVNYQLFQGTTPLNTVAGTGAAISFGNFNAIGTYTVIATSTSGALCAAQMTGSAVITADITAPTITCPANITVGCNTLVPVANIANVTTTDNCTTTVTVAPDAIIAQTCPAKYTITRVYTVTDASNLSTNCAQTITVNDQTAPTFNQAIPGNLTLSCTDVIPAPAVLTAMDACDPGASPSVIWINEIHYDNTGTDTNEGVEIAGSAGLDLTQYQLVLYNGDPASLAPYSTLSLTGMIDNEGGSGFGAVNFPVSPIQNGAPDGLALVKLPNTLIQFLSYEGSFTANSGPAAGVTSTDIGVLESGTNAVGTSLQLTGSGQTAAAFNWVGPIAASSGSLNTGQVVQPQQGIITPIYSQTSMMGACAGSMTIKRTWVATDACGNATTAMQTIELLDMDAPTFAPPLPMDVTIDCNAVIPPSPTLIASDICDMGAGAMERVWINEFHYDNAGADVNEFVEIAGTAGLDLTTNVYQIVLYNGSTGLVYNTINLTGIIDNESNGIGALQFAIPTATGFQNGGAPEGDGIALVRNGVVVQFLSYEGSFVGNGGPANGQTSTNVGVAEAGTELAGMSLSLTGTGNLYTNFAWQAPATATAGSLNTGQIITPLPAPFAVTFTTNTVPGDCPRSSIITRKWSAQDGCDNMVMHQQVITQRDVVKPILTCPSYTVNVPLTGTITLSHTNVPFTTSDNCSPDADLVITSVPVTINCANIATAPPLTITVTDQCGNFNTCNVPLVIPGLARCMPKIIVSDPCICKNNATTLTNGQFGEIIKVESLTGFVWTITAVNGLYTTASPAPPAAPIPFAIGATMTEMPAGSGDYFFEGLLVDDLGYTLTVQNQFGASLSVSNRCSYPNPTITSVLDGPFCLFSEAVPLTGTPGDANIVSAEFTINGVPATTFDPMMGVGVYEIKYTVNGGDAATRLDVNDPICIQMLTQTVEVVATPAVLVCDDFVNVSLEDDCSTIVTAGMILEGSIACFDDYEVILTTSTGVVVPNATVTSANIGQTLMATVKHLVSNNTCWGTILVEDKLPPVLVCQDVTVPCFVTNLTPTGLGTLNMVGAFPTSSDCSTFDLNFSDTFFDLPCGASFGNSSNVSASIQRDWTATDAMGNISTCSQNIIVERKLLADLEFPANLTISCANANTAPSATGAPFFTFKNVKYPLLPNNGFCELNVAYSDEIIQLCGNSRKIVRTWVALDWCLPVSANNPKYVVQYIDVTDNIAPTLTCPVNISVNTNSFDCERDLNLPDVLVSDNCSGLASIKASWTLDQFFNYSLDGTFAAPPANSTAQKLGVLGIAENLSLGENNMKYEITDNCGNIKVCTFRITVVDSIPPNPICTEITQVALGLDGSAFLPASSFDQGSYDNCSPVNVKARRLTNSSCQNSGTWQDNVKFCCSDVGNTVQVAMRVWDVDVPAGSVALAFKEINANECMVQVMVEDKIKPFCVPPPTYTVSCEAYDPTLWNYGTPSITDNCCLDNTKVTNFGGSNVNGVTQVLDYAQFDQTCNRGTILRKFTAFDCNGNTSTCSQNIVVNYAQNYSIKFPDDVEVNACNGPATFGEPVFTGKDCELTAVSYDDQVYTIVTDACRKIERTWTIINWCSYNANSACLQVNNAASTNLGATQLVTGNFNQCITYKQIIKINDQVAPTATEPIADTCDFSANNELLWNDATLFDVAHNSHDLCEGGGVISVSGNDDCSGNDVQFRALLFIDLDNNGVMETVLNTNDLNPPAAGSIWINNANNVNFAGTTALVFDKRSVPTSQKYKIGLEITSNATGVKTATLRFNSNGTWSNPQLPYGKYKIKWIITDGCGNEIVKEKLFSIKDCKKPTIVCRNGLSVNLMNNPAMQGVTLWASDFLQYAEDNCTPPIVEPYNVVNNPTDQLTYGIIKTSDPAVNAGFPTNADGTPRTSANFNCSDATNANGTIVRLWARDKAGNADFCETFISVQDNMGVCPGPPPSMVAGSVKTATSIGLADATINLEGSHPTLPPMNVVQTTDNAGNYSFGNAVALNGTYKITPYKNDNPLNGVTTYDLLLISKHILGLDPLNTPYKMIAADVNKSGSITTFDIVELRKLILGIYNDFPANTSWRFADKAYTFPNALNPFTEPFPESINLNMGATMMDEDFIAMKVGDVNGNATANNLMSNDDRTNGTLHFDVEDRDVVTGETFTVQFSANEKALGYQFSLQYEGLELVAIEPIQGVNKEDFAIFKAENTLTTSYFGNKQAIFALTFRANVTGKLSKILNLSSRITTAEAYSLEAEKQAVALTFRSAAGTQTNVEVGFELYQNTPNPFQNTTVIGFNLPANSEATLRIFDETGRTLLTKKGNYTKGYNNLLIRREELKSDAGLLFYEVKTGDYQEIRKMVILK
jgi:hypothetical protein